jgi:hypothetical protein
MTVQYHDSVNQVMQSTWIAACAHRLQRQWPRADPDQLEDVAAELWRDKRLRALEPTAAAEHWLQPVLAR